MLIVGKTRAVLWQLSHGNCVCTYNKGGVNGFITFWVAIKQLFCSNYLFFLLTCFKASLSDKVALCVSEQAGEKCKLEREIWEGGMGDWEIVSSSSFGECFKQLWAGTATDRSYLALALLSQSSLSPSPAFYQPRCLCSYMWTGELILLKTGKEKEKRVNFRQFLWLVCYVAAQIAATGRGW